MTDGIIYNNSLTVLNLNHNNMENEHAPSIADIIKFSTIKMLFIAWNKFRSKGGKVIFNALAENHYIQILDASFNSLASNSINNYGNVSSNNLELEDDTTSRSWAKSISQMFEQNECMIHMDLSHNNFSQEDWKEISIGLNKNKSVLGLHMSGNSKDTDALGFLTKQSNKDPGIAHIHTRIHESLETGLLSEKKRQFKASSNWWICEGWQQTEFKFIPRKSTEDIIDEFTPVYIHLECDDYEPDLMVRDPISGYYSVLRMRPPKELKYFFSFGDHHVRIAKDQLIWVNYLTSGNVDIYDDLIVKIPKLNYTKALLDKKSLITEEFLDKMTVKPRPEPKQPPKRIKPKTPWDFTKSIFAPYRIDNEEILANCFDIDWNDSKIPKILKNDPDIDKIKDFLGSIYRNIRECYKNYAGISPSNQVFCISKTLFNEILNSVHPSIIDSNLTITAIDLEFITTISGVRGGKFNPTRDLVRYQFLEVFVRLAIHKYFKNNICKSKYEAIYKFFTEDIGNYLNNFKSYEWREQHYFCEEVEYILKEYTAELDELFKLYSGRYTMPSMPKFVSLEEFSEMIAQSGVLKLNIANKDLGKYFNLSIQTESDELDNEKHMQMFTLEFYEAIARIADKVRYDHKNKERKDTTDNENDAIKIEDDLIMIDENDSTVSENEEYSRQTSTKLKPKEYIVHLNSGLDVIEENSAYSLGDWDKLYQKLEKFIKILIENWLRKDGRRISTKNSSNNLMQTVRTRFSVMEDLEARDPKKPRKTLIGRQNSFKMASLKMPIKHSISQINLLGSRKNS